MSEQIQKRARAEIEMDHQHGPIVRVYIGNISVGVYLADETAIVTTPEGQAGIEVCGPWASFWRGMQAYRKTLETDE